MKTIIMGIALLLSVGAFGKVIEADNNCRLAFNMDLSDLNQEKVSHILEKKGYSFEYREVDHSDFPLDEEYLLSAKIGEGFPKLIAVYLTKQGNVIHSTQSFSLMGKRGLIKALKKLPSCVE